MSLPRPNTWVISAPAAASFTTSIGVIQDYSGSVHVVYKGLDAADGTIRLKAGNDGVDANGRNLTVNPVTMTTANSSAMFNLDEMGYAYLIADYDAGSNTTGTVSLFLVRKQRS